MPDHPLLYAPAEAARQLKIGRSTLYRLLDEGTLPSLKIGRARRIPRQALEDYIASLLIGTAT